MTQRPNPEAFPPGFFFIQSQTVPTLTIDVNDGSMNSDSNILLWNKLWAYEDGFIVNKKSGLVLDIKGGEVKAGKSIIQYTRKGVMARNQEWRYLDGFICPIGDERLCIDIESNSASSGTNVILANRNRQRPSQLWTLVEHNPPHLVNYHRSLLPLSPEERKARKEAEIGLSALADWHRLVYKEKSKDVSERQIAGAAAFEAIRLYIQECKASNQPIMTEQAGASIGALVSKEIASLSSDHSPSGDQIGIEKTAIAVADRYFNREYTVPA
ncbi:hypothetical protein INT44_006564 [Umbelopsis vinacea]|uniref:Ricin B lectin domain-containing protein n=1 Tax=Umbelopsis vinacea TaxID=44442 RepID=A0A8H7PV09_9FUNG|nr:hypothetical protein INT44_006564 [Umbelopsis vinacea]